jgi:hypothetical protein
MVYPARNNKFEIKTDESSYSPIKDVETFAVSIDGGVEEWDAYDAEGWKRRMMTAKSLSITLTGKRNYGDNGNDYVAGFMMKTGGEAESEIKWTLPSGAVLTMPCVVNVTNPGGGDATRVDGLEAEFLSNGKPEFTPAT